MIFYSLLFCFLLFIKIIIYSTFSNRLSNLPYFLDFFCLSLRYLNSIFIFHLFYIVIIEFFFFLYLSVVNLKILAFQKYQNLTAVVIMT